MSFIDYQKLKEKVSIEQAAEYLKLDLKQSANQLRGQCPACESDNPRALALTPAKQLFYCFAAEQGGDCIKLVAHIKGIRQQDAAQELAQHFRVIEPPAQQRAQKEEGQGLAPLDYLQHDHEAVVAVGFEPEVAKALGIGYAPRGIMKGHVAIPVRLADGTLAGYVGVTECRLPSSFRIGGVVALPRAG